jgi:hypothetical protein
MACPGLRLSGNIINVTSYIPHLPPEEEIRPKVVWNLSSWKQRSKAELTSATGGWLAHGLVDGDEAVKHKFKQGQRPCLSFSANWRRWGKMVSFLGHLACSVP